MQPTLPAEVSKLMPGSIVIEDRPLIWELGQSNEILEIIGTEQAGGWLCQNIVNKYKWYYNTSELMQPTQPPEFRPPQFMRTSIGICGPIVAIRYILKHSKYEYLISDRKNKALFQSLWVDQDDLVQDCEQGKNND